ncbi:hypothetical protein [Persicitalea sp.]|uniref:hypothetical protein n=1 Tax=Persicitalea sp. TaxID=3100273 RepID=UPI003594420A
MKGRLPSGTGLLLVVLGSFLASCSGNSEVPGDSKQTTPPTDAQANMRSSWPSVSPTSETGIGNVTGANTEDPWDTPPQKAIDFLKSRIQSEQCAAEGMICKEIQVVKHKIQKATKADEENDISRTWLVDFTFIARIKSGQQWFDKRSSLLVSLKSDGEVCDVPCITGQPPPINVNSSEVRNRMLTEFNKVLDDSATDSVSQRAEKLQAAIIGPLENVYYLYSSAARARHDETFNSAKEEFGEAILAFVQKENLPENRGVSSIVKRGRVTLRGSVESKIRQIQFDTPAAIVRALQDLESSVRMARNASY